MSIYSLDNEAFSALVKYGSVLALKLLAMAPITSVYRVLHKALCSEEDAVVLAGKDKAKIKKLMKKNPEVERVRSAHMNDLENIVPFFLIALLYLGIDPNPSTAALLFKIFTGCRFLHTIAYLCKIRARGVGFMGGMVVNLYMIIQIMISVW